jgi:hypothetical protein
MDRKQLVAASTLLLISFCSTYYLQGILVGEGRQISSFQISGNGSDVHRTLLASRELLLNHRDPYSDAVTRKIQTSMERDAAQSAPSTWDGDQQRFTYPLFTTFLFLPALWIPFSVLQPLAVVALAGFVVWSVLLWPDSLGISLNSGNEVLWAGLLIVWLPVIQGVSLQQLGLLAYFLVAACVYLVARNKLVPAGILLAFAMIKPYMALPVALWLAFWVCGDWRRRYKLGAASLGTFTALMVAAQFLQPGWISEWIGVLQHFRWHTQSRSPLEMLTGNLLGAAMLTLALWVVVAWFAILLRKSEPRSAAFSAGLCLAIAAGVLSSPNWLFHNQVMLLPVGIWLLGWARKFLSGRQRLLPLTCQLTMAWYAASVMVIVYAHSAGFRTDNQVLLGLPFLSIFAAPPVFFIVALRSAMTVVRGPKTMVLKSAEEKTVAVNA